MIGDTRMNPQDEALSVTRQDDFQGDTPHLIACIDALLDLDDAKALVPHGLGKGSHAYRLLCAARHRLSHSTPGDAEVREAVKRSRDTAMEYAVKARIPECGKFGEIAQDLDAALSSLATPSGRAQAWRPIETAPKDGTVIDVWRDGTRETVYWGLPPHECGEMGQYCDSDWHSIKKTGWICSTFGEFVGGKHDPFTHWMPLPDAPAAPPAQDQTKGDEA